MGGLYGLDTQALLNICKHLSTGHLTVKHTISMSNNVYLVVQESKKGFKSSHLRSSHANDSTTPTLLSLKKDMFNLSNDEYYNPRQIASSSLLGFESTVVQHSIPALDLHLPWFSPHLSSSALRHFHRPQLRIRCPSHETTTGFYTISDLHKHMARKTKVCAVCLCLQRGVLILYCVQVCWSTVTIQKD